ncbi:MAG: gamma-glutamylcyclotransferase [Candidatus Lokiarchaeota archaeon]|nr:gamma-glutamylcyclotransferase [Candidatus Lokiarchaeota archaeon]
MKASNSMSLNLIPIVGYGTFITKNLWIDKANIEVCLVKNFTRIYPKGSWFPYALRSNGSFKALKFDVNKQELRTLDLIEGVNEGLFERVSTEIFLKNNVKSSAFIYIPTPNTIRSENLSLELDTTDRWLKEIQKSPKALKRFPELIT